MKMKILIVLLLAATTNVNAIGQSGVYATVTDYRNNKLTYENACNGGKQKDKIRLHDFFGYTPYFSITDNGVKHKLKKDSVYGYRNCKGDVHRFYNNKEYKIAEAGSIFIYVTQQNVAQSKGFKVMNTYYFSTAPTDKILTLTLNNLEAAFRDNNKFLDALEQFAASNDLATYDKRHKTFKVNYIYNSNQQ
ncbi:MAG: hypothetical protein JWQ38_3522 [Flavipsychrobacter sp.]|nr:hypothetical protein [Flavipsychrobacter sp.]